MKNGEKEEKKGDGRNFRRGQARCFVPAEWLTGFSPSGSVGGWRLLDLDRVNTIRCPSTPYGGTTVKSKSTLAGPMRVVAGPLSLWLWFRRDGLRVVVRRH